MTGPGLAPEMLPISALQHQLFCPRQFALIHVERQWAENLHTVEGRLLHDRVDAGGGETRDGVRISRAVALRSDRLGLVGVADVVEFHDEGRRPVPVEYKRGRPKAHRADEVQLCAQGMALEEMLDREVPRGFLFYGKTRRRQAVELDGALRALVEETAGAARRLLTAGRTPPPVFEKRKCEACSLTEICRPCALAAAPSVVDWLRDRLAD